MNQKETSKRPRPKDYSKYPFRNLSLTPMTGEVWKDIPSFDGYYCVSNFGRVWALARPIHLSSGQEYFTKEHIRKQFMAKYYNSFNKGYTEQLGVHLRYERKDYHFNVNRLVYDLFVKPIRERGKKILIVHRDGDNCNNRYDNLVAMNGTELYAHDLEIKRRPYSTRLYQRKLKPAWSSSNRPRGVVRYTLDGKKVTSYESVAEAARSTGTHRSSVRKVLQKKIKQLHGFVFRYKGERYRGEYSDFSKVKPVTQYAIDGKKISKYPSVKQASLKCGIDANSISKCALGKTRIAAGYVWRYDGDPYRGEYNGKIANLAMPIVQFSLDGKVVGRFPAVNEAWRKTGFSPATLLDCAFKRTKVSHGFVWRFEGDSYSGEYKTYRVGKPVTQQTREGHRIGTYPTIEEAAKATGLTPDNIQKNVNGSNKTAGGYVWRPATPEEIAGLSAFRAVDKKRHNYPGKEIVQYSVEGKKLAEYPSLTRAATAVGVSYTNISKVLDQSGRTAAGFVWRTKGTRYHGEMVTNPPANRARRVTQYDMRGNRVATFQSTRQAEKETGVIASSISGVAHGRLKTTGGFFWRYGRPLRKINVRGHDSKPNRKPVVKCSLDGRRVAEYPSIVDAAKAEGIKPARISEVVHGRSNSAVGHRWKLKS